jgi:hypothetical protein
MPSLMKLSGNYWSRVSTTAYGSDAGIIRNFSADHSDTTAKNINNSYNTICVADQINFIFKAKNNTLLGVVFF